MQTVGLVENRKIQIFVCQTLIINEVRRAMFNYLRKNYHPVYQVDKNCRLLVIEKSLELFWIGCHLAWG